MMHYERLDKCKNICIDRSLTLNPNNIALDILTKGDLISDILYVDSFESIGQCVSYLSSRCLHGNLIVDLELDYDLITAVTNYSKGIDEDLLVQEIYVDNDLTLFVAYKRCTHIDIINSLKDYITIDIVSIFKNNVGDCRK